MRNNKQQEMAQEVELDFTPLSISQILEQRSKQSEDSAYSDASLSTIQKEALEDVLKSAAQLRSALKNTQQVMQQNPIFIATPPEQPTQELLPREFVPPAQPRQQQVQRPMPPPQQQRQAQRPIQQQRSIPYTQPQQPVRRRNESTVRGRSRKVVKRKAKTSSVILTILLILVLSGAGFGGWYYWWTTHAVFDYQLQPIVILQGQSVEADDFLYPDEDAELISAAFRRPGFRPSAGRQNVPMTLTRGWRTLDTTAVLYVMTTIEQIPHEYTEHGSDLNAIDFVANADIAAGVPFDVRFVTEPMALEQYDVGDHILYLALNGAPFEVMLHVTDNTPPAVEPVDKVILIGEKVIPEHFVTDVFDASGIGAVSFVEEPNVFAHHNQIVQVKVEDKFGNYSIVNAALTIRLNDSPPVIEGVDDTIVSQLGIPILYRQGVKAYDSFGRKFEDIGLDIEVDSSGVDQQEVGVYTALVKAVDLSGLVTEIEVTVHVLDVDIEEINRRVDEVLDSILRNDMTQLQKVQAIHNWVRRNVHYAAVRGGPATAYEGADRALRERRGNCYIFYSISEVMLTRAGIPNMRIERIPGTPTRHRWNLVNPDELGWHHFDSFPTRLQLGSPFAFFNDTERVRYAQQIQAINGMRDYYTYDPTLYPEIAQ